MNARGCHSFARPSTFRSSDASMSDAALPATRRHSRSSFGRVSCTPSRVTVVATAAYTTLEAGETMPSINSSTVATGGAAGGPLAVRAPARTNQMPNTNRSRLTIRRP